MKILIHWLTVDSHNCGTDTYVFPSEAAFLEKTAELIRDRFGSGNFFDDETEPEKFRLTNECLAALEAGDLATAWDLFRENSHEDTMIQHPEDYFYWGEETIEVRTPLLIETLAGLRKDGELDDEGQPYEQQADDAIECLANLIDAARTALGGETAAETNEDPVRAAAEAALHWLEAEAENPGQAKPEMILATLREALTS